mgnify:FL=1
MFQNISKDYAEDQFEDVKLNKKDNIKNIAKGLFDKQNLVLYILTFMVSMVGFSSNNLIFSIVPFGLALLAAAFSNGQAIGIMYILSLIGTFIRFGTNNLLTYVVTSLTFFILVLLIRPKIQEGVNEKRKIGVHLFFAVFLVQVVPLFFRTFYVFDLLTSIMLGMTTYIFYKIFVSSISLIKEFETKKAFTIEEVMGTSLLIAIAISAFGDLNIFGFSIKNILSILIVLILGWKNGILVGATGGITIGVVLGIIGGSEPVMIAVYAVSGMIAGLLNRFGRIGVVVGFILGNVVIAYAANGNSVPLIMFQEILIASLGLLAIPKRIQINIEDLFGTTKLLPETTGRSLEENKDTVYKLNSISETIFDMAESYQEAAATILSEEELKQQERSNIEIFMEEFKNNLDGLEDNMLYDTMCYISEEFMMDIFEILLEKDIITEKDFINVLAKHNQYIVGFEDTSKKAQEDVYKIVKALNYSYRVSKLSFIWKKKMDESKKNVSAGLKGVSEAISKMAVEIDKKEEDSFADEKEEIIKLLEQKEIFIKDINIKRANSGRYTVSVYTDICENVDGTQCDIKKIGKIVSKVLNEKMIIQDQECGLRINKKECKFTYLSEDKYKVQVGIAKSTKAGSPVSGDSSIHIKLNDGKYLLALSDGKGSGPEAMKSSKIAIKMLERLLTAGFEKDVSMKLINSTLSANTSEDMFATLDIQILDLFNGNMEFIKNSACPTYIKRNGEVQLLKAVSLPTGILTNVDLVVYDYDLQDGDILVMCSDGIIDSNKEYLNKQVWLKYLLEDIQIDDAQKIADIIIGEAIDNDFGVQKDDMTVIVAKITKK